MATQQGSLLGLRRQPIKQSTSDGGKKGSEGQVHWQPLARSGKVKGTREANPERGF